MPLSSGHGRYPAALPGTHTAGGAGPHIPRHRTSACSGGWLTWRTPRPSPTRHNRLVKSICPTLFTAALLCAPLLAEAPRVGDVEFYGLHKLSDQKLLHAVHLKPGDPLPPSKGDLEDALEKIPGVVLAHVEAACCEDGKTTLFIGIEE